MSFSSAFDNAKLNLSPSVNSFVLHLKENGEKIDDKQLKKHKADVFRLVLLLNGEDRFQLPQNIKKDLQEFTEAVKDNLPDSKIFKEMRAGNINATSLPELLITSFDLK